MGGQSGSRHAHERPADITKGLQGIKVLLPVLGIVGVVCASRTRHVTNSL
jgi:hypothetical protein